MSSTLVAYPVEVRKYRVSIRRGRAEIDLQGVEQPGSEAAEPSANLQRVGHITFGNPEPIGDTDFTTRGGFLQMDRSMDMLSGILHLLRHEKPLFLHEDGTLATSLDLTFVG